MPQSAGPISSELGAFLRELAGQRFVYGQSDCAMTLANWVRERRGIDAGASLRGRYATLMGWTRIVRREGGLVALVGRLAREVGLEATEEPAPGDIGVVETKDLGPAGGIYVGTRGWAVKLNGGLVVGPARMLAAWKV